MKRWKTIFLLALLWMVIVLFVLDCKPKSKGTFESHVLEETKTCISMDSVRVSSDD